MLAPFLRALLTLVVAASLGLPARVALAQQPSGGSDRDRDLDGVADTLDHCPDIYGAPPSGCPPTAAPTPTPTPPKDTTDSDGDGVADVDDLCPNTLAYTDGGCPEEPVAAPDPTPPVDTTLIVTTTPPVTEVPVDPNDEYQQVLRTLPKDFDLEYRYDAPARKRQRDRDPARAARSIRALGISGGSVLLAGTVGLISTLSAGLVMSKNAEDAIEGEDPTQFDPEAREAALAKGERGRKVSIIGGATSGAAMALGVALLLGARSLRKKTYGAPSSGGGGGNLSDKSRRNLTIYGALLLVYGLAGVAGGAVLASKNDAKKQKNGKILLGISGTMAGIGALMFIPVIIDKFKKTARIDGGPIWVRGGGGAGVRVSF